MKERMLQRNEYTTGEVTLIAFVVGLLAGLLGASLAMMVV